MGLLPKNGATFLADGYLPLGETPWSRLAGRSQQGAVLPRDSSSAWRRRAEIAFSVGVFFVSVSVVPIYNKKVFTGSADLQRFNYPIAIAFLQLSLVAALLATASVLAHLLLHKRQGEGCAAESSWLFGPHLGYKLRHAGPAGLCFGLKYAVTNWGLQLVPAATHLLLQATDLLWTLAFARLLNDERVSGLEGLAVVLSTAGTVMVSIDATSLLNGATLVPLLVNLLTPLMLALSVTTLRAGVKELMDPRGRLRGTMSIYELTAIKLAVSATTCLVTASVFESGVIGLSRHTGLHEASKPPWWVALAAYPAKGTALILLAGVFILIFQVNVTWLIQLTSAVTVGMVGGAKVVPQWLLNAAFGSGVHVTPLSLGGTGLVLTSSLLYMAAKLPAQEPAPEIPWGVGLFWCSRPHGPGAGSSCQGGFPK